MEGESITLDLVVAQKEDILTRLANEERSFEAKKQAIQRQLVEVEKQEVILREQEINQKKEILEKTNETNRGHQEKVLEQLKILETKLAEHKMLHKHNEEKLQLEIDGLCVSLQEVKKGLEVRKLAYGEEIPSPSAPRLVLDEVDGTRERLGSGGSVSLTRERLGSGGSYVQSSPSSPRMGVVARVQGVMREESTNTRSSMMVQWDEEDRKTRMDDLDGEMDGIGEEEDENREEEKDTDERVFLSDSSFKTAEDSEVVDV